MVGYFTDLSSNQIILNFTTEGVIEEADVTTMKPTTEKAEIEVGMRFFDKLNFNYFFLMP